MKMFLQILQVSVLVILITAPIGVFLIGAFGPVLLRVDDPAITGKVILSKSYVKYTIKAMQFILFLSINIRQIQLKLNVYF